VVKAHAVLIWQAYIRGCCRSPVRPDDLVPRLKRARQLPGAPVWSGSRRAPPGAATGTGISARLSWGLAW